MRRASDFESVFILFIVACSQPDEIQNIHMYHKGKNPEFGVHHRPA